MINDMIATHAKWLIGILILTIFIATGFLSMYIVKIFNLNRQIKKDMKKYNEGKCEGPHDWVRVKVLGNEELVCKTCCYNSERQTFVRRHYLNAQLKELEFRNSLEEYTKKRIGEIADDEGLQEFIVERIITQGVAIKKEFAIQWCEDLIKESKEKNE